MEKFYYKLHTFGCQMNEYDSQVIASTLNSMGGIPVETDSAADLIILNTCCVRDSADQKIYGRLGQYKAQKRKNPGLIIAVLGCLAQKDKDALQRRFSHVDLVLGTQNLKDLPGVLEEVWKGSSLVLAKEDGADFVTPLHRESSATAYVTISIGCDCFCTYCIVPYVRGRLISRPFQEIVEEVEKLARQGFIEIFLLGQNVNTYGNDLPGRPTFTDLLKRLNRVESIKRIRFTSPHPGDFAPELIDAIGSLDKVCNWVHLPIQSGSDSVLEKMNRKYDTARYEQIVTELRKKVPGITISTDIIVGFPGETEAEFRESLDFIKRMDFDQAFMFAYSIRKGTAAARMGGHH
ncbi:MAG: tRNA (N6-isopentenyl adenosine(37)-C2)-methylthiotransferase MiaB, partial [Vulcanimicrobiota bacterium]